MPALVNEGLRIPKLVCKFRGYKKSNRVDISPRRSPRLFLALLAGLMIARFRAVVAVILRVGRCHRPPPTVTPKTPLPCHRCQGFAAFFVRVLRCHGHHLSLGLRSFRRSPITPAMMHQSPARTEAIVSIAGITHSSDSLSSQTRVEGFIA